MKIKKRQEILSDLIKESTSHPSNWKAVLGKDPHLFSQDYYLLHPEVGLYMIKEYEKNPYQQVGVGAKIQRQVDEDLENTIKDFSSDFGIIQGDMHTIASHLRRGKKPRDILQAAVNGSDLGLRIPLRGKASDGSNSYTNFRDQLTPNRKRVDSAFEQLAKKESLYQSYD